MAWSDFINWGIAGTDPILSQAALDFPHPGKIDDVEAICFFLESTVTSWTRIIFHIKRLSKAVILKGAVHSFPRGGNRAELQRKKKCAKLFKQHRLWSSKPALSFSWRMTSVSQQPRINSNCQDWLCSKGSQGKQAPSPLFPNSLCLTMARAKPRG